MPTALNPNPKHYSLKNPEHSALPAWRYPQLQTHPSQDLELPDRNMLPSNPPQTPKASNPETRNPEASIPVWCWLLNRSARTLVRSRTAILHGIAQ